MAQTATATKENITQPAPPPKRKTLRIEDVQRIGATNNDTLVVWAAPGVTQEDLRYPAFWRPWSSEKKVMPFDRFEVRAHDRTWRVECTVVSVTPDGLQIHFDKATSFKVEAEAPIDDGNFTIRNEGGILPYVVRRNRDNAKLSEHPTKAEALRAVKANYARPIQ